MASSSSHHDEEQQTTSWYIGLHDSSLMLPTGNDGFSNISGDGHRLVQLAGVRTSYKS